MCWAVLEQLDGRAEHDAFCRSFIIDLRFPLQTWTIGMCVQLLEVDFAYVPDVVAA